MISNESRPFPVLGSASSSVQIVIVNCRPTFARVPEPSDKNALRPITIRPRMRPSRFHEDGFAVPNLPGGVEFHLWNNAFEGKPKRGGVLALPPTARCDMNTPKTTNKTAQVPGRFRLPDPPRREPDEMTQYDRLFKTGNSRYLAIHLGHPDTTLVEADRWIVPAPSFNKSHARRPDLLVAFDVDPGRYKESNGYIIEEQGKPPDFVLEIASESTGGVDVGAKREDYAALGIPEYWRFDETETGRHHGERLAGNRLVEGEYVPVPIDELPDGSLQGYSAVLNLSLRWERGELVFYDPATEQPIATFEDERARADDAETRADTAEAERDAEREARYAERAAAEARIRDLEERLR